MPLPFGRDTDAASATNCLLKASNKGSFVLPPNNHSCRRTGQSCLLIFECQIRATPLEPSTAFGARQINPHDRPSREGTVHKS